MIEEALFRIATALEDTNYITYLRAAYDLGFISREELRKKMVENLKKYEKGDKK